MFFLDLTSHSRPPKPWRRWNRLLSVFILVLLTVISGRMTGSSTTAPGFSCADSSDVNPNGSSELSVLMRKMYDHAAAARPRVLAKETGISFPEEFLSIYTAKPTDAMTKNASFDPFADQYLYSLNLLKGSDADNLLQTYNNMVTACINCHNEHCPGPLGKIKKLLVEGNQK